MSITVNIYYTGTGDSALKFVREMVDSGVLESPIPLKMQPMRL
ncbi:hypothetical protein [Ligilactobacillus ruminis]|nr:hypothetical protein [Ligilactobacillus ruminis]